jgi:hypothetical protein
MDKKLIIDNLINIFASTQFKKNPTDSCEQDKNKTRNNVMNNTENSLLNTVKGFRGELEYSKNLKSSFSTLNGGWFVAKKYKAPNPLADSIYFTIVNESIEKYYPIYSILQKSFKNMQLFIITVPESVDEFSLNINTYKFYLFNQLSYQFEICSSNELLDNFKFRSNDRKIQLSKNLKSDNFKLYEECYEILNLSSTELLYPILADRYFFDILLSGQKWKGRSTDIDGINYHIDKNRINFLDIKYKTRNKGMVGHNASHLPFWLELHDVVKEFNQNIKVGTSYVLRDLDCREDVGKWKWTPMQHFKIFGILVDGGNGRGDDDDIETLMIDVEQHFKCLV